MAEVIEGEFGQFQIRIAAEADISALREHINNNFCRDEPLCQLLGYSDEMAQDFETIWAPCLAQGLSVVAIDKATGRVAGTRIACEQVKDRKTPAPNVVSKSGQAIVEFLGQLGQTADVYEKCGVTQYGESILVSVGRDYRQKGLALELYKRSTVLLRSRGLTHLKCIFSSPYTRRNGEKLGFEELSRKKLIDFTGADGKKLFPSAGEDEVATLGVLKL